MTPATTWGAIISKTSAASLPAIRIFSISSAVLIKILMFCQDASRSVNSVGLVCDHDFFLEVAEVLGVASVAIALIPKMSCVV